MKKIILLFLMLFALMGIVSAATVNLDPQGILVNRSYKTSQSIAYNINVTGNTSIWTCILYGNENGSNGVGTWRAIQTDSGVSNDTNTNFTIRTGVDEINGTAYSWDVFCNSSDDVTGAWGADGNSTEPSVGGMNYSVDVTAPSVTINHPSDEVWYTNNTGVAIGLTVTDNNAGTCLLDTNLNASSNTTGTYTEGFYSKYSYPNGTAFNFSKINTSSAWGDNNTGDYLWRYRCNDSAGQWTNLTGNYTFFVDTVAPSAFSFNTSLWQTDNIVLVNATTATDYTPQCGWNITTELNFSRYTVCYYNGSYVDTDPTCKNETTISTLATNITTLTADETYWIMISAYDDAGNVVNMSTDHYVYSTDSTNRALSAGWNIIGNVGNAITLSAILNYTGATTASLWNSSHQFQSHVSGGTLGTTSVGAGIPVLVYMAAASNYSDLVWNLTAISVNTTNANNNLTNSTNSNWSLMMELDDDDTKYLQQLDQYVNCVPQGNGCAAQTNNATNVSFMSVYNNSGVTGAKYVPFIANWSINNATTLEFGNTIWMYGVSANISINWSAI